MTEKEILNQIKGADKIKRYAVDTQAIRRGKANLALMMTLTTADHHDWFIGKFSAHYYFEFYGYRVYRRNVYQAPLSIPQAELNRLDHINRELVRIENEQIYKYPDNNTPLKRELVDRIHYLTPLLLASAANLSKKRMHYVGEICNSEDIVLPDIDLVKIYTIANHSADDEEAIEKISMDYNIPDQTFKPVLIDERTHWGMASCPEPEYPSKQDDTQEQILFKDQQHVLGKVIVDDKSHLLIPHTEWVKGKHEHHGVDLTIPFSKPYPLWDLPLIQEHKDKIVFMTDNLYLAYQKQSVIEKKVQDLIAKKSIPYNRMQLCTTKNKWNNDLEKKLRDEVQRRTYQYYTQVKVNESYDLVLKRLSAHDIAWITARLLYLGDIFYKSGNSIPEFSSVRDKGRWDNLVSVCCEILRSLMPRQTAEEIFDNLGTYWWFRWEQFGPPIEYVNDSLVPNATEFLEIIYKTLCDVIEEWEKEDQEKLEVIKNNIRKSQKFCWSSWFGEEDTLDDVNWRELHKRDIIYVLTEDTEKAYRTALKVLIITKRICNSIRFAVKKQLLNPQEFMDLAKEQWNLSPEKLKSKAHAVPAFETFNPKASLPERKEYIIDPIISERSITLMYAPPGIGKTWFAMCIALAASHGKPLFSNHKKSWSASQPRRVVYLDSEMTEYSFKKRLKTLNQIYETEHQNLRFKLVSGENINLADEDSEYCDKISQWLNDEAQAGRPVDLLVLDNLSTLTGFNDSAKSWNHLFSWMKSLKEKRKHPCSILVIHHSNKKGDQRGSSAKTATVDNVIKLEKPKEKFDEGLAFTVSIEKGRDMEVMPETFTVKLHLSSRANTKPTCCAEFNDKKVKSKKDGENRTEEVRAYLSGEKPLPLKLFAEWVGLDYGYVRQINAKVQKEKKEKKEKKEID